MATFDTQDNAIINLQELHDILSEGFTAPDPLEDGDLRIADSFILDPNELKEIDDLADNYSAKERKELLDIVTELNQLRDKLRGLNGRFHDIFDGAYC